jgi:hypothetical protein
MKARHLIKTRTSRKNRRLRFCVLAFSVMSAFGATCGSPTGPSATAHLEISGVATALKIREQRTLSAVLVDGNSRRSVQAAWTAASGDVAQVLPDGVAMAISPGITQIQATFSSYKVSSDLQVVNDYAGAWSGTYRVDACERLSGPGSSYCRFELNQVYPFDLTLSQQGADVSAVAMFYSTGGRPFLSGSFTGTSDTSGQLSLTGTITAIDPSDQPETTTIDGWRSAVSGAGMTGRFVEHRQFTNAFGPQVSIEQCSILGAQRKDSAVR